MSAQVVSTFKRLSSRLHAKVTLGVMLPLLLILGIFTIVGYRRQREAMLSQLSLLAAYTGEVTESSLRHQMLQSDFVGLQALLDTIARQQEIRTLYLLDPSGRVIFAPGARGIGQHLDNRQPECQPCHALPAHQRPDSVVVNSASGERVFRSMAPIENSAECARCHDSGARLLGVLLIDIPVTPFGERLTAYLKQNLLLWASIIASTILVVYLVVNHFVLGRLRQLVAAIAGMSQGKKPAPLPEGSPDEIGQLVRAFNTMTREVERHNQENQALSERLQRQHEQRGYLLERLITAQEDERIRVARELHDELGQSLTGLSLRAQALERHLPTGDALGHTILEQMRCVVSGTTEQMYDIIMALRPSLLDDLGLVSALRAYAERALEGTDLTLMVDDSCFNGRLPPEIETSLFRVFQEAINNTVRHACANRISIELKCNDSYFQGALSDDGHGFDVQKIELNGQSQQGLGLLGMQERVTQCGGEMEVATAPGKGTRLTFIIPLGEVRHVSEN